MEGNLGDFNSGTEKPPAQKSRWAGNWRAYVPWVLGGLGIILALWGVSATIERMASQPGVGLSQPTQPGSVLPNSATAHIAIIVLDAKGEEYALGTPLPRQFSLLMRNVAGQEYSVPFDRVGVWAVDAPDGTYTIPKEQKGLGNWSWKMVGDGVKLDQKTREWTVIVKGGGDPVVLGVKLY